MTLGAVVEAFVLGAVVLVFETTICPLEFCVIRSPDVTGIDRVADPADKFPKVPINPEENRREGGQICCGIHNEERLRAKTPLVTNQ